jgi:hypothetical protein
MSDYDYGRENGLWGLDGIPYGLDHEERTFVRYNKSEQRALANGFKEVADEKAYNGRYFIKDNLLWIHNISSLKNKLHITDNAELVRRGYDVEAYFNAA